MNDTVHASRWHRLLTGGRSWGTLDVYAARYGVARYRLVLFPPGLSAEERILLRARRSWWAWGTAGWLALEVLVVPMLGSGQALVVSTSIWLAVGAGVTAMTSSQGAQVRTMSVVRMAGVDDADAIMRYVAFHGLVEQLTDADRRLAGGELSAVDHEAVVWRAYDRLSIASA